MRKLVFIILFFVNSFFIYSSVLLKDYNDDLLLPFSVKEQKDVTTDIPTSFSFKIGKIDGEINIFGYWKLRLGYCTGFTLYPELKWIVTKPGYTEGIIFEQQRLFSMDWITDTGLYLHLFFNDDAEDTEFTFRYTVGKFFNSFYITNKFQEYQVNPYRALKGGRAQDINFGFDWGNRLYRGRFDIQFDSVKYMTDRFKAGRKEENKRLLSNQYERGIYYYLPDKNLVGIFEAYISDVNGQLFEDLGSSDDNRYRKLIENVDYKLDSDLGLIKFNASVYQSNVLVYYQTKAGGSVYEVGDIECGIRGIRGTTDFNRIDYPEYFIEHNGRRYMKLADKNQFSWFEEKNSYRIAEPGAKVTHLNADILDNNNVRISGFKVAYDEYTGCIRISKNQNKADDYNVYPFIDYVDFSVFYASFYSPGSQYAKNLIDYSCLIQGESMKLSAKPITSTIKVFYNSLLLDSSKYSYDYVTQSIILNFDVSNTDIVEVAYLTEEGDAFNLTAALKNDFRLNKYLIIGDSIWYKMPIKLWEESYYFNSHAMELIYNVHLTSDFHQLLHDKENGKLGFDLNAAVSLYYPELKGVTIVDDFEYELKGYKLNLNYVNWYPVNIPTDAVFTDLATASKGRLFYRNMHEYGRTESSSFISIDDSDAPDRDNYSDGNRIGPYSSSDGFTYNVTDGKFQDKDNTLSLVAEFELDPDEAVSFVIPASAMEGVDITRYNGINMAIKKVSLSGDLRIYVDAGKVSERFNNSETAVQKEILDNGLDYHITDSGSFYLKKGVHDGITSTNDLDGNGTLDPDEVSDIFRYSDPNTGNYFLQLANTYNNINFTLNDTLNKPVPNENVRKTTRAFRITLYSEHGASGRLLFNQIRLTESGWQYDTTKTATAAEISPIEDSYLRKRIFSRENPDFDKRLHNQRFKERTLKVNLKANEDFYIQKTFPHPIDISNFRKFVFFMLLSQSSERNLKIILTDTAGNEIKDKVSLGSLSSGKWNQITLFFDQFSYFNVSNKQISDIRMEFSGSTSDETLYIDEICLDEAVPAVGFGTKNEFVYSEPGLEYTNNDFVIFKSPYLKWGTEFNSANFLKEELLPSRDCFFNNNLTLMYQLAAVDYYYFSSIDVIFRDNIAYNPAETLRLKFSKMPDEKNPFLFTIFYDYSKFAFADLNGYIYTENKSESRNLFLEAGSKFQKYCSFRVNYDIDTNKKSISSSNNKLYGEYSINIVDVFHKTSYSIENLYQSNDLAGNFSLDNLAYIFKNDFPKFGYTGDRKMQTFNTQYGFYLIKPLYFTHSMGLKHKGESGNTIDIFDFLTDFSNNYKVDLYLTYLDRRSVFFTSEYSRNTDTVHQRSYENISWSQYFTEFNNSINYMIPLAFYPPFSSIYRNNGKYMIGDSVRFNNLTDKLRLTWDWSLFLKSYYFLPYSFTYMFTESITNTVSYRPGYFFTFLFNGGGETVTDILRLFGLNYSFSESIGIRDMDYSFNSVWSATIFMNTYKNLDLEFTFIYDQYYINAPYNDVLDHTITFASLIYKNFFRKNFITNDKYGIEMSYLIEISSKFHNRLDNLPINKVDNPIGIDLTPKIGYRFNKNFTLSGIVRLGYSADYSQITKETVHRYAAELTLEGLFSF